MKAKRDIFFRCSRSLAVLSVLLFFNGCRSMEKGLCFGWTDKEGVRHVMVFGFGIVNHAQTEGTAVLDVKAVGLVLDDGLSVGLVQKHRVEIDPAKAGNVVVSVHSTPFGLTVKNFDVGDPSAAGAQRKPEAETKTERSSDP